jgi:outer membrane protein OmpA-like peptidoglycan-associated protein
MAAMAQTAPAHTNADMLLPRWVIDINLLGGMVNQSYETANTATNYPEAVNANTGALTYKNGYSYGGDLQLGFFFDRRRHWGIGSGVMIMQQQGTAELRDFKIEYRAADNAGNIFRQVLRANEITEDIVSTNISIPVVLKYKNRFSKRWGFTADGGALINLQMSNAYTTHSSFDQEAIYKFVQTSDGGTRSVYDNAAVPSSDNWFITKAAYLRNNPGGNWQEYASVKRAAGINVGDGISNGSTKGNKAYTAGSVGFMIQPSMSYYISDVTALSFGGYYMLQPFKNDAQSGYRVTDGNGSYNSGLNNVTASTNHSYGINAGVRFFLGRKDSDHDGIADKKDYCPDVFGLAIFHGCPDTDHDSIPDNEDSCATVWGLAMFHGCPDTDSDGITDKKDECPFEAGQQYLNGCPDRDGDGIADKNDKCPDVAGLARYHGCPDTDGDGVPDNEDSCTSAAGPASNHGCPLDTDNAESNADISTPILFEVNESTILQSSIPAIEEAVTELNENKKATITIDGHADSSGPEQENIELSLDRANSVKVLLTRQGISSGRVKTQGHGSRIPAATNSTYEGKEKNRRATMKITPSRK